MRVLHEKYLSLTGETHVIEVFREDGYYSVRMDGKEYYKATGTHDYIRKVCWLIADHELTREIKD